MQEGAECLADCEWSESAVAKAHRSKSLRVVKSTQQGFSTSGDSAPKGTLGMSETCLVVTTWSLLLESGSRGLQ